MHPMRMNAPLAAPTKKRPAHRELVVWMAEEDIQVKAFAPLIGCSAIHLSAIRMGTYAPGREIAVAIERETQGRIRVADWGSR